jgi:cytochrome P450 family 4
MMTFWRRNYFLFSLTKEKKLYDKNLKILHTFTREIVEKRRETILNDDGAGEVSYLEDEGVGIKKKLALLDVLLKASVDGKALTNAEIAEEVDTFMFEGHDTVTSALCFALYLLSQNPEAQRKAYIEVNSIVGDDLDADLTYNQLQEMKYLEYCIKETLRLYPSVPMYGRNLDEDIDLDGKIVPAGSNFNIMIYALNKDPAYFENPESFIPERFDDANEKSENPFVYVPFSAGPRNCIGQKFAMLELKSTICNVLRNFELIAGAVEPKLLMQLTLKSSNGIHVGFRKRQVTSL